MLQRRNWGRWLIIGVHPVFILIGVIFMPHQLWAAILIPIIMFMAIVVLLTRPSVRNYFLPELEEQPQAPSRETLVGGTPAQPHPFRRVLAVILLSTSGLFLCTWLLVLGGLSKNVGALMLGSMIVGIPVISLFGLGVWAWGWSRWVVLLGTLLTAAGAWATLFTLLITQLARHPGWPAAAPQVSHEDIATMTSGGIVAGICAAAVGMLLLFRARKRGSDPSSSHHVA
jgi:MFS family permease